MLGAAWCFNSQTARLPCHGLQDIATRVIAEGLNPDETLVSDVMTRQPRFVESESSAVKALQIMVTGRIADTFPFAAVNTVP